MALPPMMKIAMLVFAAAKVTQKPGRKGMVRPAQLSGASTARYSRAARPKMTRARHARS